MYRIIDDKRVLNTKNKLCDELLKVKTKEEFLELTVSTLSQRAKVARTSFYRSFDNITDILDYKLHQLFIEYYSLYIHQNNAFDQETFFLGLLKIYLNNLDLIKLITIISRTNIIYKNIFELSNLLYDNYNCNFERTIYDICINFMVNVAVGGIINWKKEIFNKTPEELFKLFKRSMLALLKK